MSSRLSVICCAFILSSGLAACSPKPTQNKDDTTSNKYLVLSLTEFTGGMIKGKIECSDSKGRFIMNDECMPSDQTLGEAAFACGPSIVSIDRSWTHVKYVSFPVNWRPGNPSSLEVVKCIQSKIGFTFSAHIGAAPTPGGSPEKGDNTPFLSLHSNETDITTF